jgi:site-specific DNA-methyltransferase (adenine-specific)
VEAKKFDVRLGDCREVMATMEASSVDSIVTDPPYGLSFMGKGWDHGVPGVEFWREALRVAKPGAHMLAFGGTRTFHRLTVAIEDAGWEIRDCVMWVYGSGFPKSLDVSKAIDKAAATDSARQWQGWGTALKPAWEPIIVARKPLIGTVAKNMLAHGTGAINVDGCRVGTEGGCKGNGSSGPSNGIYGNGLNGLFSLPIKGMGRWPANVIHDGSEDVTGLFPTLHGAGSVARFFYCAKTSAADRGDGNKHPTVKPTNLMRYLCRLVTQPGGVVLDPFMGSGSTGKAALLDGFRFIGIDREQEYVDIATRRLSEASKAGNIGQ